MDARCVAAGRANHSLPTFVLLALLLILFHLIASVHDVSAASIKLAWDPSSDASVTGYRLYYGRSNGVYTNVVDAGNRTDYTVTGLDDGTTYYFAATAYTGAGDESTFSNVTSYTTSGTAPSSSGSSSGSGGGCFIATAAYGSRLAPEVTALREFRDRYLLTNRAGQAFVDWYYAVSPPVAAFIIEHDSLKTAVRMGLTPVVYAVKYPAAALVMILVLPAVVITRKRVKRMRGHRDSGIGNRDSGSDTLRR